MVYGVNPTPISETTSEFDSSQSMKESDLELLTTVDTDKLSSLKSDQTNLYYYEKLSEEEKKLYSEILYIIQNLQEEVVISSLDDKQIDKVFNYVQNDHPEIFYVEGFSCTKYMVAGQLKKISFTGKYTKTKDEVIDLNERVNTYVDSFVEELKNNLEDQLDDYSVIKYVYDYIITNTEYDINSAENQNILSVMFYKKSVCQGYAKTAQLLLNSLGIDCTMVVGTAKEGEPHAWNLVMADGDYYYMDVTWGDASYNISADNIELINSVPPVNYEYLLVNEDTISINHTFDDIEIMPDCTSMDDNYYIKEGLYFTELLPDKLKEVFENAYAKDLDYITIKMNDENTYLEIWNYLLEEQNVFNYLKDLKSVSYAENKELLYMVFWIK